MLPLKVFKNPHETLLKGIKQLEQFHWVVNAGTALGLHRDGDLIPNDTDIDVVILTDKNAGLDIRELEGFKTYVFHDNKGLPMQRCFEDRENGVIFDIYFYYREGDIAVSPYWHDLVIPRHLYENRKLMDTKYGKIYFPSPIEEYLETNYGKDWKIPKEDKGIFA